MVRLFVLFLIASSATLPLNASKNPTLRQRKVAEAADGASTKEDSNESGTVAQGTLRTTMCADKCESDCKTYVTPLNRCYNGQFMFPGDESWGQFDILDETMYGNTLPGEQFQRNFYETTDGTCGASAGSQDPGLPTDDFTLPFGECVGPFGAPRPWGTMNVIDIVDEE